MSLELRSIQPARTAPRYRAVEAGDRYEHLRLHGTTAALACDILIAAGVMDGMAEPPPFPRPPEPAGDHFGEHGEPLTLEARAYQGEVETLRRAIGRDGLIPAYKLSSADGWVVTPGECERLGRALDAITPAQVQRHATRLARILEEQTGTDYGQIASPDAADRWYELLEQLSRFCFACAGLGGFRVT